MIDETNQPLAADSAEGMPEPTVDQTHFSSVEPLMEEMVLPHDVKPAPVATSPKKPWLKWAIIGGGIFLVLLVVLVLVAPRRKPVVEQPTPTPSAAPTAELSEKQRRIQELKTDLQAADPSKMDLNFPPVDMTISVTPARKR